MQPKDLHDSKDHRDDAQTHVEFEMVKELNQLIGQAIRLGGIGLFEPSSEISYPSVASLAISKSGWVELNLSLDVEFSSLDEFYRSFESEHASGDGGAPNFQASREARIRELVQGIRELKSSEDSNGTTRIEFGKAHVEELLKLLESITFGD